MRSSERSESRGSGGKRIFCESSPGRIRELNFHKGFEGAVVQKPKRLFSDIPPLPKPRYDDGRYDDVPVIDRSLFLLEQEDD
jgi:hypothetical protein